MAFFQNDPSATSESVQSGPVAPEADSAISPHSPKSAALFKQEGQPIGSLSDYLARRLNAPPEDEQPIPRTGQAAARFPLRQPAPLPRPEYATEGQFLNSLDVDLPAGLEQYLPTAVFRLRVMKKRLDGEIFEMRSLLNKYQRLPNPSPDLQDRIRAVQHRLRVLENQEQRVCWQLAEALPMGNCFFAVAQGLAQLEKGWSTGWGWGWQALLSIFHGRAYGEMAQSSQELVSLAGMYRQRLTDRATSSVELGQLVTRYEQTLLLAEKQANQLSKTSFWARLWQEAGGLVK